MDTTTRVESAIEAIKDASFHKALVELLFQLADDDYIFSYRGSEWLALAPNIEADVAFSSINQDMMGHAVMLYQMLEQLDQQKADDLAHLRSVEQFRNAVLLERENGTGNYKETPRYDWAYAVIRSYFYQTFKRIRYEHILQSTYVPLVHASNKLMREQLYHMMHWESWLKQLTTTDDGKARLQEAITKCWSDIAGLFSYGQEEENFKDFHLIKQPHLIKEKWLKTIKEKLSVYGLNVPEEMPDSSLDGRKGEHSPALQQALTTLSEVYRLDPAAQW